MLFNIFYKNKTLSFKKMNINYIINWRNGIKFKRENFQRQIVLKKILGS